MSTFSAMVTRDIYAKYISPEASDNSQKNIGRIFVVLVAGAALIVAANSSQAGCESGHRHIASQHGGGSGAGDGGVGITVAVAGDGAGHVDRSLAHGSGNHASLRGHQSEELSLIHI